MELFVYLLFGHLVGDYLLQNGWMAYHKKAMWLPCVAHSVVSTASVCLFLLLAPQVDIITYKFGVMSILIFFSHWIVDRYELVDWWFRKLEVRSWNNFEGELHDNAKLYDSVIISFGAIVYTVADNTLHLIMMWFIVIGFYGV